MPDPWRTTALRTVHVPSRYPSALLSLKPSTWHRMCRLVMGSRCGDMDPAVVLYLMQKGSLSAQEADKLMNKQSGFLGLCGHADIRAVQEAADSGDEKAGIALEVSSGDWMC